MLMSGTNKAIDVSKEMVSNATRVVFVEKLGGGWREVDSMIG